MKILAGAMKGSDVRRSILIFGTMLLITFAHYRIPSSLALWHEILQHLYYLPIIFGAWYFGLLGGLVSAACTGICYIPHLVESLGASEVTLASGYSEIAAFFAVGAVTGILADRERRGTTELRQTTHKLQSAHEQLQSSFAQLRRADRLAAIGELAAGLAHEIRNPLGSIQGAIDIAERTPIDERRREFLAVIKKEANRLNGLLTNLLDFARPRTPTIRPAPIDGIVESIVTLISHTAQQRGVRLQQAVADNLPLVECDAEQLQQALLNVILNALQATPSGGTVSLSATESGGAILIRVRDEGTAVEEAEMDKIFEPFYTAKEGGTGLGLSISHRILAQHGGQITAERNPGKGMTFTLILPVRQKPDMPPIA